MKFNSLVESILSREKTNVLPNDLKPGDKIENCNKDCKHFKSKGTVTNIEKIKGKGGIVGNKIEYKIENKGKNFKPGKKVEKTEIQLKKIN
jgi:hypothetical protein